MLETEIDLHRFPDLTDHALTQGGIVMPGAAYLEMAFAMVMDQFVYVAGLELSNVKLSSLLTLPETQVTIVQCITDFFFCYSSTFLKMTSSALVRNKTGRPNLHLLVHSSADVFRRF